MAPCVICTSTLPNKLEVRTLAHVTAVMPALLMMRSTFVGAKNSWIGTAFSSVCCLLIAPILNHGTCNLAHPSVYLSGPRSRLLAAVAESRPVRMGDLAERLGLTARTITTLVDALEQEGLIERQADPTDRRATLIDMTPTGFRYYEHVSASLSELADQIAGPLSAEERRRLLELLSRLQVPDGVIDCGPGDCC